MSPKASLPQRPLGRSGMTVSAIGLGCMSLSGLYGATDDAAGIAVIHEALDRGINFLDSSDAYGAGHNEELVGKALKGRRAGVILSTKFGNLGGRDGKFADGRPEFVISSCEASLKRLGVEVIDLYYQHRIDPAVPVEDTVGAMARLIQQGKVRALGLSEASPQTIRRAHQVHPIAAVQNEFSLLYQVDAQETRRTTRELGITLVAYSPIGRGLLAAGAGAPELASTDVRRRHPRFLPGNVERNVELAQRIAAFAQEKQCTVGQLALAWLLAQGDDVVPIPGTKQTTRVVENIGALSVHLSAPDVARINQMIPADAAAGLRYPEAQMPSVHV
jgi:aryl-alcohol dehydrogenase-like predicted oxidoreductase